MNDLALVAALSGLEIAALITAVGGATGVVIAVLRYRREDTGMLVEQQAQIVNGMRDLNNELRTAYDRVKVILVELEAKALIDAAELKEVHAALERALAHVQELEKCLDAT